MRVILFALALIALAGVAIAAPLDIVEGRGAVKWEQSETEVAQLVRGLKLLRDSGDYSSYRAPGEGNLAETQYHFMDHRLYSIVVTYSLPERPKTGKDEAGLQAIRDLIEAKYFADEDNLKTLRQAGIRIGASHGPDGKILVSYENSMVRVRLVEAKEKAAAALVEAARKQAAVRRQAIEAAGIADEL